MVLKNNTMDINRLILNQGLKRLGNGSPDSELRVDEIRFNILDTSGVSYKVVKCHNRFGTPYSILFYKCRIGFACDWIENCNLSQKFLISEEFFMGKKFSNVCTNSNLRCDFVGDLFFT